MIRVVSGDIREQDVEAIVRPIRSDLAPVNALSRDVGNAAGLEMEERLGRLGSIPLGGAVITPGGALSCDFVIHVVVMSADEPQSAVSVQKALRNGLRRAADWALESVALPPLGMGVGNVEPEDAASALVEILIDHLDQGTSPTELTVVVGSDFEAGLFEQVVGEANRQRSGG